MTQASATIVANGQTTSWQPAGEAVALLVPCVESDRLFHALSTQVETTYAVTSLFDHVQPKSVLTWDALAQGLRLYGLLEETLAYV
jgi:hypothetical protein